MNPHGVTKTASGADVGQPLYEAAGLAWLRDGGATVPEVIEVSPTRLVTSYVKQTSPTPATARDLGRMLATLHASGASRFGAPPAGYAGRGWMGKAPLALIGEEEPAADGEAIVPSESWGRFYARHRIRPYLTCVFDAREAAVVTDLCVALESGALDHPQPAGVVRSGHPAARIHGDLWAGNVLWSAGGPVLIDPAAQGGHAEEDLATLHAFGCSHITHVIDGYQELSELHSGWRGRIDLHQMHFLMVHCYLFGRGFVPRTLEAARRSLRLA